MEMIKNYFFGMPACLAFARSLLSLEFLVEVLYISPIHTGSLVPLLLEGMSRGSITRVKGADQGARGDATKYNKMVRIIIQVRD